MQLQRGLNDSFGISFEDNILEFMVDNECYCLKSYMGFTLRKICNGKEIWVGKHRIVKFISTHSNSERSMGRMVTLKLTFTQPDCGWHQHKFKVDTNENQADKWSRWALFIFSTSFVGFGMYSIKMIWLRNLQILSNKTVAKKVNLWPFFFCC